MDRAINPDNNDPAEEVVLVRYSAVRRVAMVMMTCVVAALCGLSSAGETGFVSIFDGKTLDGWDGDPKFRRVEDGAITGENTAENPTPGNTFIVWCNGYVDNFELRLEYRIVGHNSGIQYRSFEVPGERWVIGGYQADLESGDEVSGILYGERFRGFLAEQGEVTELVRSDDGAFLKRIALIAGNPSHLFGEHEHRAGCMLPACAFPSGGRPSRHARLRKRRLNDAASPCRNRLCKTGPADLRAD